MKRVEWSKVRRWQVKMEIHMPLPSLPYPDIVVDEVQVTPAYRIDGSRRCMGGSQLQITVGGRGIVRVKGKEHVLTPGLGFLHNHCDRDVSYYYPSDGTEAWNFLWVAFNAAEDIITDINERYGYVFRLPLDKGVVKKLAAYRNYRGAVQVFTPLAGAAFIMDILTGVVDSVERKVSESPQSVLVSNAQKYIMEHIGADIGIIDLADALNVSREHLSRVFREQAGMSPRDYICKRKMRLACDLLLQSNLSCKEVAVRVGYNDHSSFSRAFRQVVGMSPRMLRENGYRPEI